MTRTMIVGAIASALALVLAGCGDGPSEPELHELIVDLVGTGSVASNPAGLACSGTRCTAAFDPGTQVSLAPTPGQNQRFLSWGIGCTGDQACTVVMDAPRSVTATFEPKVEENGLSRDINELVPPALLGTIESLGMPIHRGASPPSLEGVYHAAPFILIASNVPGDPQSGTFRPYFLEFSDQNDEDLTVGMGYVNGPERGEGLGGFIVGEDSSFTVFAKIETVALGDTADNLQVISGRLRPDGVQELHVAFFMLDNHGNSSGYFIPNNTGRVAQDSDAFSERVAVLPAAVMQAHPAGAAGVTFAGLLSAPVLLRQTRSP
jgi:Divergent InlB B-repeat domain